jgi:hypothetical protein
VKDPNHGDLSGFDGGGEERIDQSVRKRQCRLGETPHRRGPADAKFGILVRRSELPDAMRFRMCGERSSPSKTSAAFSNC